MVTKTTLAALAALTAVVATPAFAQPGTHRGAQGAYAQDYQAYGQDRSTCRFAHSSNPAFDVCATGAATTNGTGYVGSDPDPRVRSMLQNDPSESE